ncbi:hypothetical protein F8274_29785, partial [Micromonospora sp. AMSO31t]
DPQQCVERLVQLALRGGGPDNITVIIADATDQDIVEASPIVGDTSPGSWPGRCGASDVMGAPPPSHVGRRCRSGPSAWLPESPAGTGRAGSPHRIRWPPGGARGSTSRHRPSPDGIDRLLCRRSVRGRAVGDRAPPYRAVRRGGIPVSIDVKRRRPDRLPGRVFELEEVRKVGERQLM